MDLSDDSVITNNKTSTFLQNMEMKKKKNIDHKRQSTREQNNKTFKVDNMALLDMDERICAHVHTNNNT